MVTCADVQSPNDEVVIGADVLSSIDEITGKFLIRYHASWA